jgi:hypothetical protein
MMDNFGRIMHRMEAVVMMVMVVMVRGLRRRFGASRRTRTGRR